jgi:hypothetical protein
MDKPRRIWPWVAAALIAVPALYVGSFGPACWIASRSQKLTKIPTFYWPIQTYAPHSPGGGAAVGWFATLGMPADSRGVLVPFRDRDGNTAWTRYVASVPPDPGML